MGKRHTIRNKVILKRNFAGNALFLVCIGGLLGTAIAGSAGSPPLLGRGKTSQSKQGASFSNPAIKVTGLGPYQFAQISGADNKYQFTGIGEPRLHAVLLVNGATIDADKVAATFSMNPALVYGGQIKGNVLVTFASPSPGSSANGSSTSSRFGSQIVDFTDESGGTGDKVLLKFSQKMSAVAHETSSKGDSDFHFSGSSGTIRLARTSGTQTPATFSEADIKGPVKLSYSGPAPKNATGTEKLDVTAEALKIRKDGKGNYLVSLSGEVSWKGGGILEGTEATSPSLSLVLSPEFELIQFQTDGFSEGSLGVDLGSIGSSSQSGNNRQQKPSKNP